MLHGGRWVKSVGEMGVLSFQPGNKTPIGTLLRHVIPLASRKFFAPLGSLVDICSYGTTKKIHPPSGLREGAAGFLEAGVR